MLLSTFCEQLASDFKITDEGFSAERIEEELVLPDTKLAIREALAELKDAVASLKRHGVTATETPVPDPIEPGRFDFEPTAFETTGDDLRLACYAAFSAGTVYARLHQLAGKFAAELWSKAISREAGETGGEVVHKAAADRVMEIRKAYKQWAGDSDNGIAWTKFPDFFEAKKTRREGGRAVVAYGFSAPTIARVIREFHSEILTESEKILLGPLETAERISRVFAALRDKPEMSLEIVRRAFSES
jgi:hypothetical protein